MMGTKVTGKTLGLIGMGRIAQAMAYKAHHGFKMRIVFYDPYIDTNNLKGLDATSFGSIDELRWEGPGSDFAQIAEKLDATRLIERAERLADKS